MSTTTSTENSGLLTVLLPPFEREHNCKVIVIAVGSGKALKLAEAGDVDLVFVHAKKLEDRFVSSGYGVNRRKVMYNDFVIIGPPEDPAGAKEVDEAPDAFERIAGDGSPFVSRGDESGTHQKEKELWQAAETKPGGKWYIESGLGMGEVINMATEKRGYTLVDRGTYNAYRDKTDLTIVFEGDRRLMNPYSVIAVNPGIHPHVKHDLAMKFIKYVSGDIGQRIIAEYRINGEKAFFTFEYREE